MRKLLGAVFLTGATFLIVAGTTDLAAGGKKGSSKGTIELIESKDGKYRFSVRDAEGKYVGGSAVGHATEKEAKEAVEDLKKVLVNATYVSKKSDATKDTKKDKKDTKKDNKKDD